MKHSNIAIFVPDNGCKHFCSFCNQKSITGFSTQPCEKDIKNAVEIAVNSLKGNTQNTQIAFFGGSFTGIDISYMTHLLSVAYKYVKKYNFHGIRISTRPDYIDDTILNLLKQYQVTSIELGAQSMIDEVLIANDRGHTSKDVENASNLIKKHGFELGLQMMTGLYKSDDEQDILTAKKIIALKPKTVRIYPTIIMENTKLEKLYLSGEYNPTELESTVNLCATLLKMFWDNNINVIRLGLHSSESMQSGKVNGAYHQAFKELCISKIMLDDILKQIKEKNLKNDINITVNSRCLSKLNGQKKNNIIYLEKLGYKINIIKDDNIKEDIVVVSGQ